MSGESGFGDQVRSGRRAAGMTQEELANRSGISVRTISDIERGIIAAPRASTARMLADALGLAGSGRERFLRQFGSGPGAHSADVAVPVFRRVLVPPTVLIGREQTTAQVVALLGKPGVRLITLTGPGGVGKTRVAAQASAEWLAEGESSRGSGSPSTLVAQDEIAAEVVDVDLAAARDEAGLLREVAGALGDEDQGTGVDGIAGLIGERRLLLVLDNFEQLVDRAPVLSKVLGQCPRLTVLVTSRLPLRIKGEHEVAVPPLDVPDSAADVAAISASPAARMFAACATQRRADWRVNDGNAAGVAAVCRAVDGIPLAIELAASHAGTLGVAEIARRLEKSTRLLSEGPRDLPDRQRALAATIQWSFDLLDDDARALLRRLAVFPAGFSADAAEGVCGRADILAATGVAGALVALSDVGLVRRANGADGVRYQLYQTVREYAAELLATSGERDAACAAHADYVLRLVEAARPKVFSAEQVACFDQLAPLQPDFRSAMEWLIGAGRRDDAARMGGTLWIFWQERGHIREGFRLLDAVIGDAVPDGLEDDGCVEWARALGGAASLHHILGGRDLVRDRYQQAAALWQRARHADGYSVALTHLAQYEHYSGDRQRARDAYERAILAARATSKDSHIAAVLQNYGTLLLQDGDLAAAEPLLDEALIRIRNVGMVHGEANVQGTRAELALAAGDPDRAQELAMASRKLFEELGDERGIHEVTRVLADIAAARGDDAAAFTLYAESARGHRAGEDLWGLTEALRGQARAALRLGKPGEAGSFAREARSVSAQIDDQAGLQDAEEIIASADGTT